MCACVFSKLFVVHARSENDATPCHALARKSRERRSSHGVCAKNLVFEQRCQGESACACCVGVIHALLVCMLQSGRIYFQGKRWEAMKADVGVSLRIVEFWHVCQ